MDFPVATFFELDSGPFITSAVGIFKKPNGVINVGFYRCMIVDQKHLLINASGLSDLRKSYDWHRENNKEMSVAMVIGAPPPLLMAAASKCPDDVSELEVAGGMIGKGIETILSPDSGLPIPIESEIVIEAKVDLNNMIENTLGEFGNQYGTDDAPMVFSIILFKSTFASITILDSIGIGKPLSGLSMVSMPFPIIPPATSNSETSSGHLEAAAISSGGGAPITIATDISLLFSRCQS
jgi:UbiD family decarboxylase